MSSFDQHTNFAVTTLRAAPAPATLGTTVVIATGAETLFPTPPFNATLWPAQTQPTVLNAEIVRVGTITGGTFTITRAQEGSTAGTFTTGAQIALTITKKTISDLETRMLANPLTSDLDAGTHNIVNVSDVTVDGLLGATDGARFVGGVTGGPPAFGDFLTRDFTVDTDGKMWICTAPGRPGTWVENSGAGGEVWATASPLGATHRPVTQILMSAYDTDPNSSDQTAAIQAALDAAFAIIVSTNVAQVEILLDSRMVYNIGGAVTAGAHGEWAQIHWPWSHTVVGCINLRGMPTGTGFIYSQGQNGTVLRSTLSSAPAFSTTGIASMIGGPASYTNPQIPFTSKTLINMGLYALTIRSPDPVICGIDAGMIMGVTFDEIGFDTDQIAANGANLNIATMAVYTGKQGVPIIFPQVNNFYGTRGGMLLMENWPTGPVLGEQTIINTLAVSLTPGAAVNQDAAYGHSYINTLIDVDSAYGIANHDPSNASYVIPFDGNCHTTVGISTGTHGVIFGGWGVQYNHLGEAPSNMNRVHDIFDSASFGLIHGTFAARTAITGDVIPAPDISGGGLLCRVKNRLCRTGPQTAPVVPASTTTIRNPFGTDAFVTVSEGDYLGGVLPDSPLSLWTQGDRTGSVMTDAVIGANGSYANGPTLGQSGIPGAVGWAAVRYASASTQYATAPILAGNTTTDLFTMEIWVKRASLGAYMGLFNRVQGPSGAGRSAGPLIRFNPSNQIELLSSQVAGIATTTQTVLADGLFHHIAWTKNGATNKLYLDGADITPSIVNVTFGAPNYLSGATYEIAADGGSGADGGNPFDGTLDFAAVYRTALSAARVLVHYQKGSAAPVLGATLSDVVISGASRGLGGNYMLPANGTISLTYTGSIAPNWAWTTI